MKFPSLKKLNSLGVTHLLVPLLAVVAIGGIGSYLLTASHADSTQETCTATGIAYASSKEYKCTWTTPVPVINSKNVKVDDFHKSTTNWILCQQESSVAYYRGSYYNRWWGYTVGDSGKGGWVNATYAHGGINNGTFAAAPNCSGKYGAVPTLKSGSGTVAPVATKSCIPVNGAGYGYPPADDQYYVSWTKGDGSKYGICFSEVPPHDGEGSPIANCVAEEYYLYDYQSDGTGQYDDDCLIPASAH